MDILADLNPAQKQAAETIEGPLLIIAGPGSGKTRVITNRIAYLIKVCGVKPHRIMAVTFTNKAAREMRERLEKLLGSTAENLTLGTFHSICARLLRREGERIGVDPRFVIYDEDDQLSLVKHSMEELGLDPKKYAPKALQSAIKAAKSQLLTPQDLAQSPRSYFEEIAQRVYERYQRFLAESKALDFDDLIMTTVQLLRSQPQAMARYQSRYLHVLVDEFQDTNIAQFALTKQLAGKFRNLCVVGDPDQAIYSWRHADVRNILSFDKEYPDARVVLLEQNYRSSRNILKAAHHVISASRQRKAKGLWTENEAGAPVVVVEAYNEREEAQFVVAEVERLVSRGGFSPQDCAVMYRTNAQSRVLEEEFIRYGAPYQVIGAVRFYERREIKDVMAYLKLIRNPYDSVSLERVINVPGRGIGQRTIKELSEWAKEQGVPLYTALETLARQPSGPPFTNRTAQALMGFFDLLQELIARSRELPVDELIDLLLEQTGYRRYLLALEDGEERWDNVRELRGAASEYRELGPQSASGGLASFLDKMTLVSDVDALDEKKRAVTLITLHQAKGLEYGVVFMVGLEEGVLPHVRSFVDPDQMEEERRLCYVGMTRARKLLYLIHACRRSLMGGSNANPPSRFIVDIPDDLVRRIDSGGQEEVRVPLAGSAVSAIKVGDRVRHADFGEGVVVSCLPVRNDQDVVVAFEGGGVKRLLLSLAPLSRIG